ncbi:hypothetical protein ASG16_019415 [Brevibacillus sp. Leaf182]|nr:hypothetical protein ASG16_019415 [Brevibacillus sp. Leaf182]
MLRWTRIVFVSHTLSLLYKLLAISKCTNRTCSIAKILLCEKLSARALGGQDWVDKVLILMHKLSKKRIKLDKITVISS